MTAQITSTQTDRPGRRMAVSLSALAGIGYAAAWIISLSVGAPNRAWPRPAAKWWPPLPGAAGRPWPCSPSPRCRRDRPRCRDDAAARAARRCGQARAGLAAAAFAIAVAAVSWAELALGTG